MMEFGNSLKAAREAKGYTVAQMAEITHLAPTTVSELESEDFSRIAAPIYGRGFVKLYCEAVGLDPKPFVAEFMEIFSGNHDTGIRERQTAIPPDIPVASSKSSDAVDPEPDPEPESEPDSVPEPAISEDPPLRDPFSVRQHDLFGNEIPMPRQNLVRETPAENVLQPPAVPMPPPVQTVQETQNPPLSRNDHSFSRYAAPLRQLKPIVHSSALRIGILALAALSLLVLIAFGIRMVYRATKASPQGEHAVASPSQPQPTATDKKTASPANRSSQAPAEPRKKATGPKADPAKMPAATARKPQSIPALYVD